MSALCLLSRCVCSHNCPDPRLGERARPQSGLLVQKLKTNDLQSERTAFDGTMVYAQNKRQQVVLTKLWAQAHLPSASPACIPAASTPQELMGDVEIEVAHRSTGARRLR
uniref:Uncharacterized protein n=1 Tax=Sus scrofa TaxID=9823 RepID=A0A480MKB1_PIG